MKLYTLCELEDALIKTSGLDSYGIKLEEYSYDDYLNFIKEAGEYYIDEYHYWYETDMSDRDEGSTRSKFTINYSNMIIKDNKLFGVLIKTNNYFPKYYIYKFKEEKYGIDLSGGYNENSFTWTYKNNEKFTREYILVKEVISTKKGSIKKEDVSSYHREIIGLFENNYIVKDNKILGFKLDNHEYLLSVPSSLVSIKIDTYPENDAHTIITLQRVDKQFLELNLFEVSYQDSLKKKYKIYTKLVEE